MSEHWLLNVQNQRYFSYTYLTAHQMCSRTEEEVGPTVGLPSHRLFVGFFYRVRPSTDTGSPFLPRNRPISVAFLRRAWRYGERIVMINPRVPFVIEEVLWSIGRSYLSPRFRILNVILEHDNIQWYPLVIRHYINSWLLFLTLNLITKIDNFTNFERFP